jgi:glycosyltransferase involved in cell wall biosynthesis
LIKVLHILDSLNRGGAEIMALDLCRNARGNGLQLTFVASGGGDLEEDFRNSGVEFIRLDRRLPVDLSLAAQLRKIIAEREIDLVHSHQPVEALHLYLATRGSQVKRVLTLHGIYPGTKNDLALRFVLPRTDACVVVSREVLRVVRERGVSAGQRFVVVNNGVDPARLEPSGRNLRVSLGLAEKELLLGMVGNFHPVAQKDQLTVCRALTTVLAQLPRAQFVFVGGRSEAAPHLFDDCVTFCREQGLDERVHFLGKRSDIADVLGSLDVFVLSTRREGSPISVIEAMLLGLPVVLSDIPPLREVSNDGKCAVLFKTGEAEDLATSLIDLAANPQQRTRLSSEAKQWAISQFSIDTHIANLLRLYSEIVGIL